MKKDLSQCFDKTSDLVIEERSLEFPLTITQLAKAAQTTVHTTRNYVLENLVFCCGHSSGGYGLFDRCALNRLRFIRAVRESGLLLLDIKPLLYAINNEDNQAYDLALKELQDKINERHACLCSLESLLSNPDFNLTL